MRRWRIVFTVFGVIHMGLMAVVYLTQGPDDYFREISTAMPFYVGSVMVVGLYFGVGALIDRYANRRRIRRTLPPPPGSPVMNTRSVDGRGRPVPPGRRK